MLTLEVIDREIDNIIKHGTDYTDCGRLADLYICKAGMTGKTLNAQSTSLPVSSPVVDCNSSEFVKAASKCNKCWEILDELMAVLQTINPRLYAGVLRRLQEAKEG